MFLLAYISSQDASVALVTAVVLFLTVQFLSYYEARLRARCNKRKALKQVNQGSQVKQVNQVNQVPNEVNLSESQAKLLSLLLEHAQTKNNQVKEAEKTGNQEVLNARKIEAFTAEEIVDTTVTAIQHQAAADQAQQNGDVEVAKTFMDKAQELNTKVNELLQIQDSQTSPADNESLLTKITTLFSTDSQGSPAPDNDVTAPALQQISEISQVAQVQSGEVSGNEPTNLASISNPNTLLESCIPQVQQADICSVNKSDVEGYVSGEFASAQ